MLHYIEQPIEKNLTMSFEKLALMDQRRGVNSSKIFTELYKLKWLINFIDLGTDNMHPGPKQHQQYAETLYNFIKEN